MNTNVIVHLSMMWPTINEPSRRRLYVKNECRKADERAQKGLMVKGARILVADIFTQEDVLGIKHKLIPLDPGEATKFQESATQQPYLYSPVNVKHQKLF
jgi:hypothetical protein